VLGHPGKLAKISTGQWDTHSSRSESALPIVARLGEAVLGHPLRESTTVEGLFGELSQEQSDQLGDALGKRVREAVLQKIGGSAEVAVVLVNMKGEILGQSGELSTWQ
jgi:cobalt-precorrin-5B (C1)-methyltransferase